jgi:hypothetical protein
LGDASRGITFEVAENILLRAKLNATSAGAELWTPPSWLMSGPPMANALSLGTSAGSSNTFFAARYFSNYPIAPTAPENLGSLYSDGSGLDSALLKFGEGLMAI